MIDTNTNDYSDHNIIYSDGYGELIEKKSRFIAYVHAIHSEEEAIAYISQIKKQYYDARHTCFAYTIGENREITRFSDDSEPSGTAGKPILDVLTGNHLYDTIITVTRYFGGTLLGTGGLVRAYGGATKIGLENAKIAKKINGQKISLSIDYTLLGKLQHLLAEENISILDTLYDTGVTLTILVPIQNADNIANKIIDQLNGNVILAKQDIVPCIYLETKLVLL
jgi:uncharacterized YigZ family protein